MPPKPGEGERERRRRRRPLRTGMQTLTLATVVGCATQWQLCSHVVDAAGSQRENSGSGSDSAGTTKYRWWFANPTLYVTLSLMAPAAFALYKLWLYIYFRRTHTQHQERENEIWGAGIEELQDESGSTSAKADFLREQEHARYTNLDTAGTETGSSVTRTTKASSVSSNRTSLMNGRQGSMPTFWVEQELQPWRLDYQNLQRVQCLHAPSARTTSHSSSEIWTATLYSPVAHQSLMVVMKWVPLRQKDSEALQEKLKLTIRRQATLEHPNVATFYGISWSLDTNFVAVSEHMEGGDMRTFLQMPHIQDQRGYWSLAKINMLLDVAKALAFLHGLAQPLAHGNCNSRNVLLTERMHAKLSDFGALHALTEDDLNEFEVAGSGRWLSPEALMGQQRATGTTDVYSLGILMTEMDTHQVPFADLKASDRSELPEQRVLQLIINGALSPTLTPTCPPEIQALVEECTHYTPSRRPPMRDVVARLERLAEQERARPSALRSSSGGGDISEATI